MHSIRFKITAITVAAILTTIASILTAWGYTFQSENDRRSVEIMSLISRDTQNALEDYFQSVQLSVELTSNTAIDSLDRVTLVENGVAGAYATQAPRTQEQIDRMDAYLADHCRRVQETFQSVASRTRGVVTYYYAINPEVSEKVHGFYYSKVGKAGFHRQTPPDPATFDPEDETHAAWYFTPIERGQPCWVGPYNDSALDELWVISYVVPVYRAGRLIGLLGMDIPVETLVEQVSPIHVYETGFASLYDTEGRVIYHPTLPVGSTPEEAGLTSQKGILLSESSGSELIRYTMDGEERQIAFTTLSNGMRLVVSAPVREINAWWLRLTRYIIITSVVVILLYVLVLTFVVRLITQPLRLLTEASQKLADADYDVALTVRGKDEVGMLTRAFIQMRAQLKQYIEDLNHRIYYDTMTDLPNMRYFFNLVEKERDRMVEAGQKPVMLYFNLVGIKHYNRQYGFDEGDRLICEMAGILRRHFGDKLLCRISSDHFAAVSDATGLEAVLNELFMECLAANGGQSLPVRVGIYPNELEDVNVNVACDRAKYACDYNKGNFTSGYIFFDEKMLRQAENTRYIISHLDQALKEQWIKVYYQPIIRAVDGKICDEEALARWIDPDKGMLSPADFIPILEDARLIYKLDLYMLDRILEKMKLTANMGITVVPHSVNLSRSDFDACDIVEEIRRRVDDSGIARKMITIEITESIIGSDFEFMKSQIERFQSLGFPVWMDDFGSGYSSLDVLQTIRFDLLKFDMSFTKRLSTSDNAKIILSEMMKMAIALGVDTICEGVETAEHVQFLREIGCSKLQGYYYCRPVPVEYMFKLSAGRQSLGFENPAEAGYYEAIGRVNLFDLSMMASESNDALQKAFDTLPMGILEFTGDNMRFLRSSPTFRTFMKRYLDCDLIDHAHCRHPNGCVLTTHIKQCCAEGSRGFFEDHLPDGSLFRVFVRKISVNPVTDATAAAVAVLSISELSEGADYASIAQALAADYYNIYYVNLEDDRFIEYRSTAGNTELAMERRGEHFFDSCQVEAQRRVYSEDLPTFLAAISKENVIRVLNQQGMFTTTYRLMDSGAPMYVSMKIMRMQSDDRHIIIGVSSVDAQMKEKAYQEELQKDRATLARIMALSEDYLSLYIVTPDTDRYVEYNASNEYKTLGVAETGEAFFDTSIENGRRVVMPDDLPLYLEKFTKENILREIRENGMFHMEYRIIINDVPEPISLRIAPIHESDGDKLVVGLRLLRERHEVHPW